MISIILATYNDDSDSLDRTILSIKEQTYNNWELIIIESDDCGVKSSEKIKVVKVPPKGVADALNHGLELVTGDYVYIIGAGDYLWSDDVFEKMMCGADPKKDMLLCGRINRTTEDGTRVLYTSTLNLRKWMMIYKMGYPHQGLFTNRRFFEKYGMFDVNCKYAMDYDLLLRAYKEFPAPVLKEVIVAAWRAGGVGKGRINKVIDEYHQIRLKNKIAPKVVLWAVYLLTKFRYILIK
jgi:glycosyltransferase involved in cell wall biosynthesis